MTFPFHALKDVNTMGRCIEKADLKQIGNFQIISIAISMLEETVLTASFLIQEIRLARDLFFMIGFQIDFLWHSSHSAIKKLVDSAMNLSSPLTS
jgi:hypothetical protein